MIQNNQSDDNEKGRTLFQKVTVYTLLSLSRMDVW